MNPDGSNQANFVADDPSSRGTENDNPAWQPVESAPSNTYTVRGHITRGSVGLGSVTLSLSGTTTATTITDALGNYQFENLPANENYTITPSLAGYVFAPSSKNFANLNAAQTADFSAAGNGLCVGGTTCPANGKILYTYRFGITYNRIASANSNGTGETILTPEPIDNFQPSYSPDGNKIIFVSTRNNSGGVFQMNADGINVTQLAGSLSYSYPSYSPDGTSILFVRNNKIWTMNADGSNQIQLTNTQDEDNVPSYSPDGNKIAFTRYKSGSPTHIYIMNADGTNQKRLTNDTGLSSEYAPSYSPDGRTIVFLTDSSIHVINADGSNRVLISTGIFFVNPSYSPDGTKILCGGRTSTGAVIQIYIMNSDGSDRRIFSRYGDSPDWQPIPRQTRTPFDFDGDGRADVSVFRPSNGFWYQLRSQNNAFNAFQFGQSGDKIAPADYDGDGRADVAVFRDVVPGAGDQAYIYITYRTCLQLK